MPELEALLVRCMNISEQETISERAFGLWPYVCCIYFVWFFFQQLRFLIISI